MSILHRPTARFCDGAGCSRTGPRFCCQQRQRRVMVVCPRGAVWPFGLGCCRVACGASALFGTARFSRDLLMLEYCSL